MKKLLVPLSSAATLALAVSPAFAQGDMPISIPRGPNVNIESIGLLVGNALALLLILAAIAAFIFLILGGIQWITSGGDKQGLEGARNKITNAIVGLIIVAAAWAVMFLVGQFLGIENLFTSGLAIPRAYEGGTTSGGGTSVICQNCSCPALGGAVCVGACTSAGCIPV